jgi:hypothetical protein
MKLSTLNVFLFIVSFNLIVVNISLSRLPSLKSSETLKDQIIFKKTLFSFAIRVEERQDKERKSKRCNHLWDTSVKQGSFFRMRCHTRGTV